MSEKKCPICQNNLHKINIVVSTCTNDKCKLWGSSIPNLVLEALAQAKQDLERTRKALDVAVDVLKEIDELLSSNKFDVKEVPLLTITQTKISMLLKCINIEQITALEQKDVK